MKVVADSGPLIAFAKIGGLDRTHSALSRIAQARPRQTAASSLTTPVRRVLWMVGRLRRKADGSPRGPAPCHPRGLSKGSDIYLGNI